jgi:hypothetical protein
MNRRLQIYPMPTTMLADPDGSEVDLEKYMFRQDCAAYAVDGRGPELMRLSDRSPQPYRSKDPSPLTPRFHNGDRRKIGRAAGDRTGTMVG